MAGTGIQAQLCRLVGLSRLGALISLELSFLLCEMGQGCGVPLNAT